MYAQEQAVIVIPARMASKRFPGKPLAMIRGKTMLERVFRIGQAVPSTQKVLIATEDEGLKAFAEKLGAEVCMTSPLCPTGTDRVAEVASTLDANYTIFFSLQGDAVLTPPWVIEELLRVMLRDPSVQIATPAVHLTGSALEEFLRGKQHGSSSGTTVAFDLKGNALYFSKAVIPYCRAEGSGSRFLYRHIGLYAYRREVLQRLSHLPEGPIERSEQIEIFRALEHGIPVRVVEVDYRGRTHGSVDRPEDIAFVESCIDREGELISS